jgi:hypothetical protein
MQLMRLQQNVRAARSSTAAHTQAVPQLAQLHRRPSVHVEASLQTQFASLQQLQRPVQQQQQRQQQQLVRCSSSSGNTGETISYKQKPLNELKQ